MTIINKEEKKVRLMGKIFLAIVLIILIVVGILTYFKYDSEEIKIFKKECDKNSCSIGNESKDLFILTNRNVSNQTIKIFDKYSKEEITRPLLERICECVNCYYLPEENSEFKELIDYPVGCKIVKEKLNIQNYYCFRYDCGMSFVEVVN